MINFEPHEATSICIQAVPSAADALTNFLAGGASSVRDSEPGTLQWIAQQETENSFRIVDFFSDEDGRTAHFAGQVAAALKERAPDWIEGGWEQGIVANVSNSIVLSCVIRDAGDAAKPQLASYIQITACPGQEEALAGFLTDGAAIVRKTEPDTVLWYALRLNNTTFAIYDVFVDAAARETHFQGKVAAALQESASKLVEGGWETGVAGRIVNADVLSITY